MSDTRILLAEDETITRMDLREMLENLGYTVVGEAGDGVAAVNLARTLKPDLVLMDIKMPGVDGISAAETLSPGARHARPAADGVLRQGVRRSRRRRGRDGLPGQAVCSKRS